MASLRTYIGNVSIEGETGLHPDVDDFVSTHDFVRYDDEGLPAVETDKKQIIAHCILSKKRQCSSQTDENGQPWRAKFVRVYCRPNDDQIWIYSNRSGHTQRIWVTCRTLPLGTDCTSKEPALAQTGQPFEAQNLCWTPTALPGIGPIFRHYAYITPSACVADKQVFPTAVMMVHSDDWKRLRVPEVTHKGAFGNDYGVVTKNVPDEFKDGHWTAVWKFPYDLNQKVVGFVPLQIPVPVGTYPLYADSFAPFKCPHSSANSIKIDEPMQKIRDDTNHVSFLQAADKTRLAIIGTWRYMKDYWEQTEDDKSNMKGLLADLKAIDICAISCHEQHHALVFYSINGNSASPETVARALQDIPAFEKILTDRCLYAANANSWINSYKRAFL